MVDTETYKKRYTVYNWMLKKDKEYGDLTNSRADDARWSSLVKEADEFCETIGAVSGTYERRMVSELLNRLNDKAKGELK